MKKCAARRRCGLRAEQRRSPLTLFSDHYQKDRKSTRLNSSHSQISYAVFCLKKKKDLLGELHVLGHGPVHANDKFGNAPAVGDDGLSSTQSKRDFQSGQFRLPLSSEQSSVNL